MSAEETSADPTTVKLKLNPKAVWGDGSPIDIDDLTATWKACDGTNKKFECASTQGFDQIASITAGADKFDVTVTFKAAYPDWSQPLVNPVKAESVKDPETFNNGWKTLNNDWLAGPFKVESFDNSQKVLTEVPNDKWWGDKPLLDKITFRAISSDATAAAFANNELDSFDIGPDPDAYKRVQGVSDASIRAAAGPNFRHFTFNTKAGVLTDQKVRQAIVKGLDREAIGASDLAGIDWPVQPLNNNILLQNQEGYKDVAAETGIQFDPEGAKADLDALGWTVGADGIREKDGKKLAVKFSQLSGVPVSAERGTADAEPAQGHRRQGRHRGRADRQVPGRHGADATTSSRSSRSAGSAPRTRSRASARSTAPARTATSPSCRIRRSTRTPRSSTRRRTCRPGSTWPTRRPRSSGRT